MNIALDLITAAIILSCLINGFKNGFIKSVLGLFSNIFAAAAAFILCKPVGVYFDKLFISRLFEKWTVDFIARVENLRTANPASTKIEELLQSTPSFFTDTLHKMGSDISSVKDAFAGSSDLAAAREAAVKAIYSPASAAVSRIIAFFAVFAAVVIILKLISFVLTKIISFGMLSGINKLFGLGIGAVEAALLMFLLVVIVKYAMPYTGSFGKYALDQETISNTIVFSEFYDFDVSAFTDKLGSINEKQLLKAGGGSN